VGEPPLRTGGDIPTDSSHYRQWSEERVRFNDVDMQGHVNNAVIPAYFESGRLAINRLSDCPVKAGKAVVVAQVLIRYLLPIKWPAILRIGTRVSALSERSFTLHQAIFLENRCMACSEVVLVSIDIASERPTPHGTARKQYLKSLM
jgi:acyl-CoA thioester hydrolase